MPYYYDPYSGAVRFSLAVLMVLFPVFLGLSYYQNKQLRLDPARKDVGVRKWLLFLTLFLAAALVIGDLITLINTFLNGEVTSRFLYKVLAVLIIAGLTLYYYLLDLRGAYIASPRKGHTFGIVAVLIVLGSVVSGFFIIGSPMTARLLGFDNQKVTDLMNIQTEVVSYWQNKSKLPTTLAETKDTLGYGSIPVDKQRGEAYTYTVKGANSFEICATFNKASNDRAYPSTNTYASYPQLGLEGDNWKHPAGNYCFSRTIDPDIYKTRGKTPVDPTID